MQFQERLVPSIPFAPGAWRVTTVTDDEGKVSIDLGWSDDGSKERYSYFGTFDAEPTAVLAIERIESVSSAPDIRQVIASAGFERVPPSGFSVGGSAYRKTVGDFLMFLTFDGMGEATLSLAKPEGVMERIGSLAAGSPRSDLRAPARQTAIATFVLCALSEDPSLVRSAGD